MAEAKRQGQTGEATLHLQSGELSPHCTASGPLLCFWQWAVCKACEQEIKSSGRVFFLTNRGFVLFVQLVALISPILPDKSQAALRRGHGRGYCKGPSLSPSC